MVGWVLTLVVGKGWGMVLIYYIILLYHLLLGLKQEKDNKKDD